jgi:flagellar basal body-associated protein FliL
MFKKIAIGVVLVTLALTGYVYWFYFNVYSDGNREGVMVKISRKGNIFKTYEGEMVLPGLRSGAGSINSNNFKFSVVDSAVYEKLEQATGNIVKVHYVQYRRSLPWRGDSYDEENSETGQYVVDSVIEVGAKATGVTQLPTSLPNVGAPLGASPSLAQ